MKTSYVRPLARCLILVLRDGVIAERGSFAELMRRDGVFADLYNTQFRDTEETSLGVA